MQHFLRQERKQKADVLSSYYTGELPSERVKQCTCIGAFIKNYVTAGNFVSASWVKEEKPREGKLEMLLFKTCSIILLGESPRFCYC